MKWPARRGPGERSCSGEPRSRTGDSRQAKGSLCRAVSAPRPRLRAESHPGLLALSPRRNQGNAKAEDVGPDRRAAAVAAGRPAEQAGVAEPAAAPDHSVRALGRTRRVAPRTLAVVVAG